MKPNNKTIIIIQQLSKQVYLEKSAIWLRMNLILRQKNISEQPQTYVGFAEMRKITHDQPLSLVKLGGRKSSRN